MSLLSSFIPVLYAQISPDRLTLRNARTGEAISEIPEMAIGAKSTIVGVGAEARMRQGPAVQVVNPFAHPRSLMSDFTVGEQLLKAFVRRLLPKSIFAAAPKIVIHPLGEPAGGLTQVEIRALREMALGAGASKVVVWEGAPLTDQELLAGRFPATGRVLD
ncbi:MAG: rod shape-determining protein [Pseudomonadota bacterium]